MAKKLYKIPVSWTVCAIERIRADSLDEALQIALDRESLPQGEDYVEGSFNVDTEIAEGMNEDV